jgi:hypothetical protein
MAPYDYDEYDVWDIYGFDEIPMEIVDESIGGGPGAATADGKALIDFGKELGYPLGQYVITYVLMAWAEAIISLAIYLTVSLTKIGAAFSWVINIH